MKGAELEIKKGKGRKRIFLILTFLLTLYFLYPYYSAYRLFEAITEKDEVSLEHYVDWPSLREGLKSDFTKYMVKDFQEETDTASLLGSGLGLMLGEVVIERFATPGGLISLLSQGNGGESIDPDYKKVIKNINWAFFSNDPFTFKIEVSKDSSRDVFIFIFRLQGAKWQLTRIYFPQSTFDN